MRALIAITAFCAGAVADKVIVSEAFGAVAFTVAFIGAIFLVSAYLVDKCSVD